MENKQVESTIKINVQKIQLGDWVKNYKKLDSNIEIYIKGYENYFKNGVYIVCIKYQTDITIGSNYYILDGSRLLDVTRLKLKTDFVGSNYEIVDNPVMTDMINNYIFGDKITEEIKLHLID